ncbi:EAL domain-containing protein [Dolichospermum sp. UHCC 0684]|uniref:EAL domain-containing protein n=1 Tax=unclassified Dolichospermum TaxID=2622029 RepID=UPI0014486796|nr:MULTISPECIES: EAL domain-containing protein [unclassified Dolichospermum]MEA5529768.1 EAL domain-containing protein [Dolichospermum sp. UHCC 0684]MTJ33494.1 EAL domain-containing protein [Dolichospermum sp. UHCC 0260]
MEGNETEKIRHLLVVQDPKGQRTLPLLEATYSLGRDLRNAIVLYSPSVSRQHAILLRVTIPNTDQYGFRIIDGNFQGKKSTNGLFVNGHKCLHHNLQNGDVIAFDSHTQAKYYVITNLSEQIFSESCQTGDLSNFLSGKVNSLSHVSKAIMENINFEAASETALARLASFPELIPNAIIEMDLAGRVTYVNPAAVDKFPNLRQIAQEHPILTQLLTAVKNQVQNSFVREVTVGNQIFEQSVHYLPESNLIRTFIIREITEQKQAELELKQRDRLLQAVAEAANYLLAEMNYDLAIEKALAALGEATNVERVYLFQNHPHPVSGEMSISMQCEWIKSGAETSHSHWQNQSYQTPGLERWYSKLFQGETISDFTQIFSPEEQKLLMGDNIKSLLFVPLRLETQFWGCLGLVECKSERYWSKHEESSLITMAASISGARQRQQVEEKIRYQAMHDLLTGLPNRLRFNDILNQGIQKIIQQEESIAVMFLDLDRFKIINDTLGHTVGDDLLKIVAQRIRDTIRIEDVVARWGGDEFTIFLPRVTEIPPIIQIAKNILQTLEDAFYINGHELYISSSIGIALLGKDSPDAETLIQHADAALYYAKNQGRNNYQFYKESLSQKNPGLLKLEKNLRHAIKREELMVYYQPRVNITTGKITGMEALLRWNHSEMGVISPAVFIPLAEESGLIISIGEWVLRQACIQNKAWQDAGYQPITIAVNLSPRQFRQPKLVEILTDILTETQLKPEFLELEITETTAIADINFTTTALQNLAEMGLLLAIDDFGTGYSSLNRLKVLPFHNLKIDQSFIRELTTDPKVAHIIQAIVTLGQSLGLRLIAEGVEHPAELEFLRSIHCDEVQGYLLYRPLSVEQATEALKNENK